MFSVEKPFFLCVVLKAIVLVNAVWALPVISGESYTGKKAMAPLTVYSERKEALIKPLLDEFTASTQVKVNLLTGKGDALLARLKLEKKNSPADVFITTDVGRLSRAKAADLFQAAPIPELNSVIPPQYRDAAGYWYGLSLRSRVLVYAKDRVDPKTLSSYEALGDAQWKQRICVRSSSNVYNQSLVASLIEHHGLKETEAWLKRFVGNMARPPKGGDRDQIKAVASGQCDVALVNSYYFGAMLTSKKSEEKVAAEKVALFWPNQSTQGAHMNVSGIGVTRHAPNPDAAKALIRFLASPSSQAWYAKVNHEYPVRKGTDISPVLAGWGTFKADDIAVEKLGEANSQAVMAMDRAKWR